MTRTILPLNDIARKGNESFYITRINELPEFNPGITCISTGSQIIGKIRSSLWSLLGIGASLLLIGFLAAHMISKHVLTPISHLAHGMEQIRNRQFHHRLPDLGNDELGQLCTTFNQVIEGMADLEVGVIVQETFFPPNILTAGSWEVFGSSVPASKVGGDYYDYFPLPDGKTLIVIGDVAGHGVAAALVVAMVKALVLHPANPPGPAELLTIINQTLFDTLHRSKLMSCFVGVFDPVQGQFTYSNGGHNYPYLVSDTGSRELKMQSLLLGAKRNQVFSEQTVQLENTDWLCFYTDGIVEALDAKEEMIGYKRFSEALPSLRGATSPQTEQALRKWHKELSAEPVQADDITLIVLQRSASAPQQPA